MADTFNNQNPPKEASSEAPPTYIRVDLYDTRKLLDELVHSCDEVPSAYKRGHSQFLRTLIQNLHREFKRTGKQSFSLADIQIALGEVGQ